MAVNIRDHLFSALGELRYEPTPKRIRARFGDRTVIDSRRAFLVWEPKRIVPSYAIPAEDIDADIVPSDVQASDARPDSLLGHSVLTPHHAFGVRVTHGSPVSLTTADRTAQGFRLDDPDLAGRIIVDFNGFDAWLEEDEPNVGHARDPFHRVEILHGSHHVVVEHDGTVIADSHAPYLLFEPPLPVRYYLPAGDVVTEALVRSETRTTCAYKGHATHWSLIDAADVAWSYETPLRDARDIAGRFAFYNERVDITVDGEPLERPVTPWSSPAP